MNKIIGWLLIFIGGFLMGWGIGHANASEKESTSSKNKIVGYAEVWTPKKNNVGCDSFDTCMEKKEWYTPPAAGPISVGCSVEITPEWAVQKAIAYKLDDINKSIHKLDGFSPCNNDPSGVYDCVDSVNSKEGKLFSKLDEISKKLDKPEASNYDHIGPFALKKDTSKKGPQNG